MPIVADESRLRTSQACRPGGEPAPVPNELSRPLPSWRERLAVVCAVARDLDEARLDRLRAAWRACVPEVARARDEGAWRACDAASAAGRFAEAVWWLQHAPAVISDAVLAAAVADLIPAADCRLLGAAWTQAGLVLPGVTDVPLGDLDRCDLACAALAQVRAVLREVDPYAVVVSLTIGAVTGAVHLELAGGPAGLPTARALVERLGLAPVLVRLRRPIPRSGGHRWSGPVLGVPVEVTAALTGGGR